MRIKELRKTYGKTQDDIAELLEIARPSYAHYETGRRNPDIESLCKLADYYDVTLDYLVGRTDIPNIYKVTKVKKYEDHLIVEKAKELIVKALDEVSK